MRERVAQILDERVSIRSASCAGIACVEAGLLTRD